MLRESKKETLKDLPMPIPSAGLEDYLNERRLAISKCEKKKSNYEKYLRSSEYRDILVDYLPIKMDIENVSRCNFRCTMCQVSDWKNGKRARDLTLAEFKSLIDEQIGLLEIKLQGMGEPLLQGDDFFEMIKYAREKNIWVRSTSNASLFHLKENYKKLIDCDTNEVQISIDGASKEVFERIRRQSNFERVAKNCELINNYCEKQNVRRTKMWVVVQKDNYGELCDFVTFAKNHGFKDLVFSLDMNFWGQSDWQSTNKKFEVTEEIDYQICKNLVDQGHEFNVRVSFWFIGKKFNSYNKKTLCPWPWERAYISSDSRIVACCMVATPSVSDLGNAGNFSAAWNGIDYQAFRQAHVTGNIPDFCSSCYDGK